MPAKKNKEIKLVKGTFRPCREKKTGALCKTDKIPDPPKFLSAEALGEWNRIAPLLFNAGLLSDLDTALFAGYCRMYGRHVQAEKALEGQSLVVMGVAGGLVRNPLLAISHQASERMIQAAKQFGLTPASRSKVVPKKITKKNDAWEDF
ncbi:phage terminase small subunit P27 family [Candidatus Babeliales bacterium]|nr:phage terminase small subunit P27 family [Candidatus Babeliales bacterium]